MDGNRNLSYPSRMEAVEMRWAYLLLGFLVGLVAAQTVKFPVP
jgi:hypothetical protein